MSPRRKIIYKWSYLGPLGLIGFYCEVEWLRNLLFFVGGSLSMVGSVLQMQIIAERILSEKRPGHPDNDLG